MDIISVKDAPVCGLRAHFDILPDDAETLYLRKYLWLVVVIVAVMCVEAVLSLIYSRVRKAGNSAPPPNQDP